jgi:hypothetical protein
MYEWRSQSIGSIFAPGHSSPSSGRLSGESQAVFAKPSVAQQAFATKMVLVRVTTAAV